MNSARVFVTGGSGYMGRSLIPVLLQRGHQVRALVRAGSEARVPAGCEIVVGNVLDRRTFASFIRPGDIVVHLVGTPRPSPAKAKQFREVDLVAAREAIAAAAQAAAAHFVYVSVAQPAPVMRAYIATRAEAEALIRESGLPATVLRPWYVLGPGHHWPYALLPLYWMMERFAGTRSSAERLGLVTLKQMIAALVEAVERTPTGIRIVTVPEIRACADVRVSADAAQPQR